jgi:acyl-coenzyme A synthetase/AMP-(fatty) acid ligase
MLLPLITHSDLQAALAWSQGQVVSAAQYLADVQVCAEQLPDCSHVLIACQDRYAFAVGFGAALQRGQVCMLPATHTALLIQSLQEQYSQLYCLIDAPTDIALPQVSIAPWLRSGNPASVSSVPSFARDQLAAIVFTSGSTGLPVPNKKTWGKLTINVKSEGNRLGVVKGSHSVMIGTVPPQHMYGFESTVLIAMQNACAFESSKPFYPADIALAVQGVQGRRVLVTTPFHLRALVEQSTALADLAMIVSATAPLAVELAREAETKLNAPLLEIYGSTETGQLSTRRTTASQRWQTFDGITLHQQEQRSFASGDQVEGVVPINDLLTLHSQTEFTLHGRTVDMVNIAGKSTTLTHLNHQLLAIPGVIDGCFFMPTQAGEGIGNTARVAAVVVAPTLTVEQIQEQLRLRVATAFLPRPLKLVDHLPRNSTGKLPREVLLELIK